MFGLFLPEQLDTHSVVIYSPCEEDVDPVEQRHHRPVLSFQVYFQDLNAEIRGKVYIVLLKTPGMQQKC